jgi:hypothetical protein
MEIRVDTCQRQAEGACGGDYFSILIASEQPNEFPNPRGDDCKGAHWSSPSARLRSAFTRFHGRNSLIIRQRTAKFVPIWSRINSAAWRPLAIRLSSSAALRLRLTNWRSADLVELQAVESGSANWKKVLGALKAGQWTWAKVPQGKNCHVDLRGKYADGKSADVSNVDVCADKTVDLVN